MLVKCINCGREEFRIGTGVPDWKCVTCDGDKFSVSRGEGPWDWNPYMNLILSEFDEYYISKEGILVIPIEKELNLSEYDRIYRKFRNYGIYVSVRKGEVMLVPSPLYKRDNKLLFLLLALLTIASTTFAGYQFSKNVYEAISFSASIFGIISIHELSHRFASNKNLVSCSLPYFIPMPFFPLGTLGALIKVKGAIPHRRALAEIGLSGPFSGFLLSVILLVLGLSLSSEPKSLEGTYLVLGEPLIMIILKRAMGLEEVLLHPIAFAAWAGIFITFLNLIPSAQLDGGHIVRGLAGKKVHIALSNYLPMILILAPLANLLGIRVWTGWAIWGLLLIFLGGGEQDTLNEKLSLGLREYLMLFLYSALVILSFTPNPVRVVEID